MKYIYDSNKHSVIQIDIKSYQTGIADVEGMYICEGIVICDENGKPATSNPESIAVSKEEIYEDPTRPLEKLLRYMEQKLKEVEKKKNIKKDLKGKYS